jgi:winged helix DNA-binding protein
MPAKVKGATADDRARAERHRLTPGLALRDLDEAAAFLAEMGLLLQTPDPYLPSLFGAAQGKPFRPGVAGFGQWPEHAWFWAGELAQRDDVLLTKLLRGKRTLVHRRLWPALDAAVRERAPESDDERAIVERLEERGPARTDELRTGLGLSAVPDRKRYQRALERLEAIGAVLCRPALVDKHKHVSIAQLWKARFPEALSEARGVHELVRAVVRAGEPVPARELQKWFAWPRAETAAASDELVAAGQLRLEDELLRSVQRRAGTPDGAGVTVAS